MALSWPPPGLHVALQQEKNHKNRLPLRRQNGEGTAMRRWADGLSAFLPRWNGAVTGSGEGLSMAFGR